MSPEDRQALKDVLERLHNNSVYAFNRVKAVEMALIKNPELWNEYVNALRYVESQDVHRDFGILLDKIQ